MQTTEEMRAKLIERLAEIDEQKRPARADRIMWASQHQPSFSWALGTTEAMRLMSEARVCYVHEQYMACVVLATAYIEHTLVNRLQVVCAMKGSPSFAQAIQKAREENLYAPELLDRCDRLRQIRNPFAHKRPSDDPNTLSNRYISEMKHPLSVLESDAQEALAVMYKFFSPLPAGV